MTVLKDKPITDSNISTIVPLLDDLIDRYDTTYTEETDNAVDNLLEHINTYNNNVLDNMLDLLKKVTRTKKIEEFYKNRTESVPSINISSNSISDKPTVSLSCINDKLIVNTSAGNNNIRKPVDLIFCVDTSGSMGVEASVTTEKGVTALRGCC